MKKGVVISGGFVSDEENLATVIDSDTIVVCADSGYVFAKRNNIIPKALIGDFDSIDEMPDGVDFEIIRHKVEKDESDTQLCIDYLISKGVTEIFVYGALGGKRFDHTFANIQLLEYGIDKGVRIVIKDRNTEIFLVKNGSVEIHGCANEYLSVFALNRAENVSYTGLKYKLENAVIESGVPYGLSNVMLKDTATVSVENGTLLIIHTGGDDVG